MLSYTIEIPDAVCRKWLYSEGWVRITRGVEDVAEQLYSNPELGVYAVNLKKAVNIQVMEAMWGTEHQHLKWETVVEKYGKVTNQSWQRET